MKLLDEIWRLIFTKYLDFVDTARCRLVSKRFKYLIDNLGPTELAIYDCSKFYNQLEKFYVDHDREPVYWIQLSKLNFFRFKPNSSFQIMFKHLKFLQIYLSLNALSRDEKKLFKKFNLEFLNEFTSLEKLYLNEVSISRSQTLRLPRLKVFSIELFSRREAREDPRFYGINYRKQPFLVLDSKVERLFCARATLLVINHPECIEFLECRRDEFKTEQLAQFKSLKVIYLPASESVVAAFRVLESLEELHLNKYDRYANRDQQRGNLIRQLINERGTSRRNVKIYFSDILLPFKGPLFAACLQLRIEHYHELIGRVREVSFVWYESLIEWLSK